MLHKSFFSASQAVKSVRGQALSSENDMKQVREAMVKMRSKVDNMHTEMNDIAKRFDALKLGEVDPMKDAIKDLNERIKNAAREVEHSRNKMLNLEEKASGSFDKIAKEIKTKIFEMDNMDERIKEVVTKAFSEHEVGKSIMEDMAEGMHARGSEISKLRKDIDFTNEQLPQLAVQYSEWQHNHLQLEAEMGSLSEDLQQFEDGAFQEHAGAHREKEGGVPDMSSPGIGVRPQTFNMSGGPHIEIKPAMDPWQQWFHNLRSGHVHSTGNGQHNQPTDAQHRSERNFEDMNKKSAFSEKVAMAPENRYDGEHKAAQWRFNVRPYLISRAPSTAHVSHHVEEHEDQSDLGEDLVFRVGLPKSILMQLSLDLWGF